MTETPPPGRSWDDEPEPVAPDEEPAWVEPEPPTDDSQQYDEWLAAEDQLHDDEPPVAEPPPADPPELEVFSAEVLDEDELPPVDPAEVEAVEVEDSAAAVPVEEAEATPEPEQAVEPVATEPAGAEAPPVEALGEPPATAGEAEPQPADEPAVPLLELSGDEDATVPAVRSVRNLLIALVAAVVVLAALTAFLAVRSVSTRDGGAEEDARRDALAASRTAARLVFSYDYRHLDKDFKAGKAVTTGEFAKEYERTTGKLVDEVAAKYKAVVAADISEAAVVRADDDRVVTLVFLNQQSTSTLNSGSKITQSRLEMTLVHRGGRWLVEKIRAF